jgi:hypothetical protein
MVRFHAIWRLNPSAPWPTDPSKLLEMEEKIWAAMDELMKKGGGVEDWGAFPDVHFGYVIGKGETVDMFRNASTFYPYIVLEVHEIIPYGRYKETIRAVRKAQIAAMKK